MQRDEVTGEIRKVPLDDRLLTAIDTAIKETYSINDSFLIKRFINYIFMPITFNNPLKVCFSNKKYPIAIQTSPTQIVKVYFLLENRFLTDY